MEFDEKYTVDMWCEIIKTAFEGVNFIDTAEVCGLGQSEKLLGGAIQKGVHEGVFSREDLIISTKIFFGCKDMATAGTNGQGSTRKHILEGTQASLGRLGLDYVDVIFCHRPDPFTPVEETVRAMNYVINKGWALYWGTSEWLPSQINEACEIADRLNLIRPKSQYNIFERSRVEYAYVDLYKKYKLGLTTWSPLAFYRLVQL
ncbi:Aldo/keto reductase family [Phytophthora infestans]|uniref:Aldo/keto reductase family n=1 Tax=Phytophthora infestans TaxID=4787 RepID=A0A8S9V0V2_PHYIN|nr:Aldo/keto reductase family [Phytophthora infestans]